MINFRVNENVIENVELVIFDKDGTFIDIHKYWGKVVELRARAIIKYFSMSSRFFEPLCNVMGYDLKTKLLPPDSPVGLYARNQVQEILTYYLIKNNIEAYPEAIETIFHDVAEEFMPYQEDYTVVIDDAIELIKKLKQNNVKIYCLSGMKFSFAKQSEPLGNGHAILMAKKIIGKRDFIVMWPDDVYINFKGECILKELCDVYEKVGGVVENIMEFPKEEMVRYGALINAQRNGKIVKATGLVEKPALKDVPSNYASMGPYILPNIVMDVLEDVKEGGNGEINLTDAINLAVEQKGIPLTGVLTSAERFDCGTNQDLAKANIRLCLTKHPEMRTYVRELLKKLPD